MLARPLFSAGVGGHAMYTRIQQEANWEFFQPGKVLPFAPYSPFCRAPQELLSHCLLR